MGSRRASVRTKSYLALYSAEYESNEIPDCDIYLVSDTEFRANIYHSIHSALRRSFEKLRSYVAKKSVALLIFWCVSHMIGARHTLFIHYPYTIHT